MAEHGPILFALGGAERVGTAVARQLEVPLAPHEERIFEQGEHKIRPLCEVGRRDVYVIQSLHGDAQGSVNDRLIRLLFFIAALKDAGAAHVTALTPYLAYNRKDRRTKPRDPVNSRSVAALFEAVGTDRIIVVEAHNVSAFENAFRACRPEHVPVAGLLADHFLAVVGDQPVAAVSPDAGGNKRAELFRSVLERRLGRGVGKAIMDKHRSMGKVSGSLFAGDVAGQVAIIVDDLIASGETIVRTTHACRAAGATRVIAAAAHGLFSGDTTRLFGEEGPDEIVVSDSVPLRNDLPAGAQHKLRVITSAPLLGDVISRLQSGEPVSELIPYD